MTRRRARRAGRLIQEEISKIIQRELKDPRIGFVTVTGVDVTDNMRYAKVFVTVLKKGKEARTLKVLEHAKGFIRREIGHRIKLRFTPEIEFRFDESTERGAHIDEVLRKIATARSGSRGSLPSIPNEVSGREPQRGRVRGAKVAEKPAENAEIKKEEQGRK